LGGKRRGGLRPADEGRARPAVAQAAQRPRDAGAGASRTQGQGKAYGYSPDDVGAGLEPAVERGEALNDIVSSVCATERPTPPHGEEGGMVTVGTDARRTASVRTSRKPIVIVRIEGRNSWEGVSG
jgi:hypothetical protein